jgi:uncharacterized protein (DUF697 family)
MAEQDYSKLDLIALDKAISDLTEQKNEINKNLERGYAFMYVGGSRKRVEIPQFSPQYESFISQTKQLDQEINTALTFARNAASSYTPPVGPSNKTSRKEQSLANKYVNAKISVGPAAPTGRPAKPATLQEVITSATTGSTATTGTQTNVPVTTTPKITTTPTGTTTTTTGKGKKTPAPAVTQQNWVDALQKFFPSYSDDWLASNAETYFGKDLIDLMIRVSDPKGVYDLTTSAGLERIQQEIRGTNYWQTTISATKNFDQLIDADKQNLITQTKSRIANTYGDIGLTEDTLSQVAATVARTGLTGLGEKQAVYNAVFKAGAPQMQTGRALSGVDADRIKQLGKAYNFNVTDSQIQSILTGTPEVSTGVVLTEEGLRQRLQKYVKGAMPQIADQIDAGLTLEDIGGNYRRYAAQLLERSEDEIDMFSGPYLKAFGTKESGQLSLGDWISTVKTDPTFGWQYTKTANQQATDIGLTLARAFGKVG